MPVQNARRNTIYYMTSVRCGIHWTYSVAWPVIWFGYIKVGTRLP